MLKDVCWVALQPRPSGKNTSVLRGLTPKLVCYLGETHLLAFEALSSDRRFPTAGSEKPCVSPVLARDTAWLCDGVCRDFLL